MWTDSETTVDLLGFRVHADLIRSVVTDDTLIPVVIGVFGDWGGGKSSIMKMLQEDFSDEEKYGNVVCLYFNGWMFEGYEDAKTALLSSILVQLGEHKTFGKKLRAGSAKLLKKVNLMGVAKTTLSLALRYGPSIYSLLSGDVSHNMVPQSRYCPHPPKRRRLKVLRKMIPRSRNQKKRKKLIGISCLRKTNRNRIF